jgi:Protein of unknown function (DUF1579)
MVEHSGNHFGTPFSGVLVIGHDPQAQKYSGLWLDSLSSNVARYDGALDAGSQVLLLTTELDGNPVTESIELKSPDDVVLTTRMKQGESWLTVVTVHYRRQK